MTNIHPDVLRGMNSNFEPVDSLELENCRVGLPYQTCWNKATHRIEGISRLYGSGIIGLYDSLVKADKAYDIMKERDPEADIHISIHTKEL